MAVVVGVVLLVAACSSDGGGGQATDVDDSSPAASAPDRDAVLKIGFDLIQTGSTAGFSLDPLKNTTSTNDGLQFLIFGRMMRPTPDGDLVPDLAETVTLVDTNAIDITLRPGVTFQDGTPFDAAAVKAGLDRTLTVTGTGVTPSFFDLKAVDVTGPGSLRLSIPNGTAASWFDKFMGSWETTVVKPDTDFAHPIGAGPMKLAAYTVGQSLSLDRWDGYWDTESVNVGGLDLVSVEINQPQSGLAALQSDQVDLTLTTQDQIPSLTGDLDVYSEVKTTRLNNLMICKKSGPLADPKVRVALNQAIDRQAISDAVYAGTAEPATELWPEGYRFFDPALADELAYDPDQAKQLLIDVGYPDGIDIDMYVLSGLSLAPVAEVMQQQMAAVGIRAQIVTTANYVDDYLSPQKDGLGLIPTISAGPLRLQIYSGTGLGNACKYQNPQIDALYAQLNQVSGASDEAVEIWKQIDALYATDAPGVPIVWDPILAGYNTDVVETPVLWAPYAGVFPDVFNLTMQAEG